uniref:Uncharacterized protein n=1 Tax=Pseudomonas phage HRDY3 TaxID=3236930 RepID=A0AB39CDS2_9VIRU
MKSFDLPIQNDRRLNLIRLLQEAGFTVQSPWPFDRADHGYWPPTIISKGELVITTREVEETRKDSNFRFTNCRTKITRNMSNERMVDALLAAALFHERLPELFEEFVQDVFALFNATGTAVDMSRSEQGATADQQWASFAIGEHEICEVGIDMRGHTGTNFSVYFPHINWIDSRKYHDEDDGSKQDPNVFGLMLLVDSAAEILPALDQKRPYFAARKRMFENKEMVTLCQPGFFADAILRYGVTGMAVKKSQSYRESPCPFTCYLIDREPEEHDVFAIQFKNVPVEL